MALFATQAPIPASTRRTKRVLASCKKLETVIESRRDAGEKESYTARLLAGGPRKAAKKVGEEAVELAMEADNPDTDRFLDEAADLVYHLQVLLAARNLKPGRCGQGAGPKAPLKPLQPKK
jgi:phosphoribosyl-ATP pyrophosphohydrolase